ncbi:hypothetical protein JCM8547_008285 [Rhodosporidiobolus lusitaniae]
MPVHLNDDVLRLVADHLRFAPEPWVYRPARRDFLALALTCKAWHAIGIEQLYREINVEAERAAQVVEALKRNESRTDLVRGLVLRPTERKVSRVKQESPARTAAIVNLVQRCTLLTNMSLRGADYDLPPVLQAIQHIPHFTNIRRLTIVALQLWQKLDLRTIFVLLDRATQLEHFKLRLHMRWPIDLSLFESPTTLFRLKSLSLRLKTATGPPDHFRPFLLSRFDPSHLTSFTYLGDLTELSLHRFIARAGTLTSLRLHHTNWRHPNVFQHIHNLLHSLPALRTLLVRKDGNG